MQGAAALGMSLGLPAPGDAQPAEATSRHERQLQRTRARIDALEAQNIGEKDWYLKGEVQAGQLLARVTRH